MIKSVLLSATVLGAMTGVLALPVSAEAAGKVFVCKYVGTPGVDERLQTGNNPISVSVNAIKDYKGVGSYFVDAQGRSYVLAEDTRTGGGQEGEPSVNQCPAPDKPADSGNPGEPGKGDITPPTQNQTPTPVATQEASTQATQPATASAEALPYTASDHTLAYTLIAAGLATIVTGIIIGTKSLYRHSA